MAIPPQFMKNVKGKPKGKPKGKQKQDTAAQDAKESPAKHAKDLASGRDKPNANDVKRQLLLQQTRGRL